MSRRLSIGLLAAFLMALALTSSPPHPALAATGGEMSFPSVSCRDDQASVAFSWQPTVATEPQWLDVSTQDDGFAPGTFISNGPLEGPTTLDGLSATIPYVWRIRSQQQDQWLTTAAGSFLPCGSPRLQAVSITCVNGQAIAKASWTPQAAAGSQWLDVSAVDDSFVAGTFTGVQMPASSGGFSWQLANDAPEYYVRISALSDTGWLSSAVATLSPSCHNNPTTSARTTSPTPTQPAAQVADWASTAQVSPGAVSRGAFITINTSVTSHSAGGVLVDVEVVSADGKLVHQGVFDRTNFTGDGGRTLSVRWLTPTKLPSGTYTVKVGIFGSGWGPLKAWNDSAATFTVR